MTFFDLVVLLLLGVSGLVGFVRGATREVVTVFAFLGGALAALFALRFTGPIARRAIDPDVMGLAAAWIVVFLAVYILLRVIGASLTKRIHQTRALGSADRFAGIAVGLVRALVLIGVFHLVLHAATPEARLPGWLTNSASYPLSGAAADGLRVVAREGSANADGLAPAIKDAIAAGEEQPGEEPSATPPSEARP